MNFWTAHTIATKQCTVPHKMHNMYIYTCDKSTSDPIIEPKDYKIKFKFSHSVLHNELTLCTTPYISSV